MLTSSGRFYIAVWRRIMKSERKMHTEITGSRNAVPKIGKGTYIHDWIILENPI
jgi:hypothetical protein